jgi:tyrosyl-tRNA synthetase
MNIEEKIQLISEVGEELTTKEELATLLKNNPNPIAYDGFEPSGKIHLPQGLIRAININKITKSGFKFKMLVADWHAWANHKLGGDLEKIKIAGEYFIEVWKACGMDIKNVEFVWASDLVKTPGYWETVMKIAIKTNLARVLRTTQIMGREASDTLSTSQIMYPLLQCADIFILKATATQLGMDQRKVNMLAREIGEELGFWKPVVISHHMILGLLPPTEKKDDESSTDRTIRLKMSKSNPDSAIFMTDTNEQVTSKIRKAWCPEGEITENPILEYSKYLVFEKEKTMLIKRSSKFGGDVEYTSFSELEKDFADKKLFPLDLKNSLTEYIIKYLQPISDHFKNNEYAKNLKNQVDSFTITK